MCFKRIVSYCCDTHEGMYVSAVCHEARRQHCRVRYHTFYEDMMMGTGSSRRMAEKTMITQIKVRELPEKAKSFEENRRSRTR